MRVLCKTFRGFFKTWDTLLEEAAQFATGIGPEHLISISHSADNNEGLVAVWYWGQLAECHQCGYNLRGNVSGRCPECGASLDG